MTPETAWISERIKQDQIDRYLEQGRDFIDDGDTVELDIDTG